MPFRVMTVCTGNICRSPLAAAELRNQLPAEFTVCSSGLSAIVGAPAHETMCAIAAERGLDLSDHEGTQLDDDLIMGNNLILVMTSAQKDEVLQQFPVAIGRIFLLGQWGAGDIPDPYGGNKAIYVAVDRQIQEAVKQWLPKLIERYETWKQRSQLYKGS